ncbi:MAG: DNA gyrase inhibitor YacG [Phycisphaerae bacterium]
MIYRCPTCKKKISYDSNQKSENSRFFPFCSERCKMIDLGAWFDSNYKICTPLNPCEPDKNISE